MLCRCAGWTVWMGWLVPGRAIRCSTAVHMCTRTRLTSQAAQLNLSVLCDSLLHWDAVKDNINCMCCP